MNAKYSLSVVVLLSFALSACGAMAATTLAPDVSGGHQTYKNAPEATSVPWPTSSALFEARSPESSDSAVGAIAQFAQPAATQSPWQAATTMPIPAPEDNYFRDYGVNPYVETAADHLSTFALDVDTASYTVTRQYLRDGLIPPMDSIRVEEFVNFFRQDYPLPPDAAFGIYADGAPTPFQEDRSYLLRIGIQGYDVAEAQRKPLVLTFVIDVSGSMEEQDRLGLVQQSLVLLIDRLRPTDSVAIVAFTDYAWTVMDPTPVYDREAFRQAIYSLYPMATTNVEKGLRQGYALADSAYRSDAVNRVILCSDGVANVDSTSAGAILEYVHSYTEKGIALTTIGVGMGNYNDVLLEQLADNGNGNYAYVDTLEEARRVLVEDMTSTLQVIAMDAKVQMDFNPDTVIRYRLIGYENRAVADQNFRNDSVDAGEIGAGHTVTALYAVQLKPGAVGRIATVQLRWQDPATRQVHEINGNFNTWELKSSFEEASDRFQLAATVVQFADYLRGSPWAAGTSIRQLSYYASRLAAAMPEDPDVREFAELVAKSGELLGR